MTPMGEAHAGPRGRPCGTGILPVIHGRDAHATRAAVLRDRWFIAGLAAAVTVALAAVGWLRPARLDATVVVYEAICIQLIGNVTEGRQALVGSVWWPPVPVLLRLPLVYLLPGLAGLPSLLVSAGAGVLTVLLLARFCLRRRLGVAGALAVLAVAANPEWIRLLLDGSSGTLAVFLMVLTALAAFRWLETGTLRGLTALGGSAMCLALTGFDAAVWLLAAMVVTALLRRLVAVSGAEHRAALLLALLPLAYGFALWMLMNWLIMGDGLYFLRPLFNLIVTAGPSTGGPAVVDVAAAVVACLAALVFACRRQAAGVCLAALSVLPVLVALALDHGGILWSRVPLLAATLPLAILSLCALCAGDGVAPRRLLLAAAAALLLVLPRLPGASVPVPPPPLPRAEVDAVREAVAATVLERSPHALVFVAGFPAYGLLGADGGEVFRHALDFNFHQARLDYRGHDLYLLVKAPYGRDGIDSIHWQYDQIYELGSRNTLYVGDWDGWRLFELIQAPVRRE